MKFTVHFTAALLALCTISSGKLRSQTTDTVCNGNAPNAFLTMALAAGGYADSLIFYTWEQSPDGTNWSDAQGLNNDTVYQASGLTQNTFFRRRVDASTCGYTAYSNSIFVLVLDSIEALVDIENTGCPGTNDGAIYVAPLGGLAPYTFIWNNNSTDSVQTSLTAGTYTLTITDDFGCSSIKTYTVVEDFTNPPFAFASDTVTFTDGVNLAADSGYISYQWSTGDTTSSIYVNKEKWYYVTVTDSNGCSTTDSIYAMGLLGIDQIILSSVVQVYPNPTLDVVNFRINNNTIPDFVKILDTQGSVIYEQDQLGEFNMSSMARGVYFIEIHHKNQIATKRLILE